MSVSRPGIEPVSNLQYVLVPPKEKLPGAFKIVSLRTEDGNPVPIEELRDAVAIRLATQASTDLATLRNAGDLRYQKEAKRLHKLLLSTGVQPNDGNGPVVGKSFFALGQAAQHIKDRLANILRQTGRPVLSQAQADAFLESFEPKATKLDVVIQRVPDSPNAKKPFRVKTVNILG